MGLVTPPVNVSGEFSVLPPYQLETGMIYKCQAVRTIEELLAKGMDVFGEFYNPKKVPHDTYTEDQSNRASIITLISADNQYVYIPNSFIESYPGMSGIPYSHKVIFVELGMMPDAVDVNYLVPLLRDTITHATGVNAEPRVGVVPYLGSVSHQQHINLERTRRVAIQNYETNEEIIRKLTATNQQLVKANKELTTVIAAHPGLQTPTAKKK